MSFFDLREDERGLVVHADNLRVLSELPDESVELVYIDPPFNTGRAQTRVQMRTERDPEGDRIGFQGERYRTERVGRTSFADRFDDYLAFLEPRLVAGAARAQADGQPLLPHRLPRGALLQGAARRHLRARVLPERDHLGLRLRRAHQHGAGRPSTTTSSCTSRIPRRYHFDTEEIDRIPYMAPGLVGPEKAARGKLPTDTWWHTIVSPTGKEKTGYPTQKPLGILERIVRASCPPRRPGARLLRRQRHDRRGRAAYGAPLPAGRFTPGGARRDAAPLRQRAGHPLRDPTRAAPSLGAQRSQAVTPLAARVCRSHWLSTRASLSNMRLASRLSICSATEANAFSMNGRFLT